MGVFGRASININCDKKDGDKMEEVLNKVEVGGGDYDIEYVADEKHQFIMSYNGKGPNYCYKFVEISNQFPTAKIIYNWFYYANDDIVGGGGYKICNGECIDPYERKLEKLIKENVELKRKKVI